MTTITVESTTIELRRRREREPSFPSSAMSMLPATGNQGCPCIDASKALSSFKKRSCQTASGESGVLLGPEIASCVPLYYGSNTCLKHDMMYNSVCSELGDTTTFCLRSWCYVDVEMCKINSTEKVVRSDYFGRASSDFQDIGSVDLFYSYTTCNSTEADWESYKSEHLQEVNVLGKASLVSIPSPIFPLAYKLGPDGEVLLNSSMPEYKNDEVPFEGVLIDYINDLIKISGGDITKVEYTSFSNSAKSLHPESSGTAAIQDVADGLVDMAIGPLWITKERLKLTAFTVPIVYDKTVLVLQKPGSKNTFLSEANKVWQPFKPVRISKDFIIAPIQKQISDSFFTFDPHSQGVWGLILLIILVAALLSVWFTNEKETARSRSFRKLKAKRKRQSRISSFHINTFWMYSRLALDSMLEKGMFFFGASVNQHEGASLSNKLLMFGFAFFILIAVSAYVANLAAFLTRPSENFSVSISELIDNGKRICAHPALDQELKLKWPDARFVFDTSGNGFFGILQDYDAGKCDVMAIGREDTMLDKTLMEMFCERELVYTDSLFLETPIAFASRPELISGLSYWILEGEKFRGVSLEKSKKQWLPKLSCSNVELNIQEVNLGDDYAQISPENMILPTVIFVVFAGAAIIVRIWQRKKKIKRAGEDALRRAMTPRLVLAHKQANDTQEYDAKDVSRLVTNESFCENGQPDECFENQDYDADADEDENDVLISTCGEF